jgi:hypothetical protein
MKVSEIMSTPIEEVMDNDTVIRAARKMRVLRTGSIHGRRGCYDRF